MSSPASSRDDLAGSTNGTVSLEPRDNPAFDGDTPDDTVVDVSIDGDIKPPIADTEIAVLAIAEGPDDADEEKHDNCCSRFTGRIQTGLSTFYHKHKRPIWLIIYTILLLLYGGYFSGAMWFRFGDEGSIRLLGMTCLFAFFTIIAVLNINFGKRVHHATIRPAKKFLTETRAGRRTLLVMKWTFVVIVIGLIIFFLVYEVGMKEPYNLVSLAGLAGYILICYIGSYSPAAVKWRPVITGLLLQFVFALVILRTRWGFLAFQWLGDRTTEFLSHSDAGATFLFTNIYVHFFAFKVLPVIIFFSTMISVFYYLGWMQALIKKIAWVMQTTMGTTAGESLNAAGNIFIGQSEAPLMIRPLIQNMTKSEIHAIMTGGFATIAGSVFGAYVAFGVPPNHLLSASVMSAPAALAMAKLFYPETKKSITTAKDVAHMEKSPERNIIEAASSGASQSIKLVANIAVNLIAFLSILAFLNETLKWIGVRVGLEPPDYPYLSFELISSYLFYPLAVMMGANIAHCRQLAMLIGLKTFTNEFIAYERLGVILNNNKIHANYMNVHGIANLTQGNPAYDAAVKFWYDDVIHVYNNSRALTHGILDDRTMVIATYTLCGFANFGSIGVMIGCLTALAPHRKEDIAAVALRAMIAGNVACFMTACIAGLLYQSPENLGVSY